MRKSFIVLLPLFLVLASTLYSYDRKPIPSIPKEQKEKLTEYLKSNWKSPEDYIISKFSDYDYVFLGQAFRIKHHVVLIHNLIPLLYEIGVRNIGIVYGCHEYQDKADSLVTSDEYDESLARWLMFKHSSSWGFIEYQDIYRKAWEFNRTLSEDAPKLRIVNLGYRYNWAARQENMTPELWKKVRHKGGLQEYMASVIFKEFVEKGQKALIFSHAPSAFTRYHRPVYDFGNRKFIRFNSNGMGNIVYKKIPDKVFNVSLHYPWPSEEGSYNIPIYPAGGVIDGVMKQFDDKRIGFDVKGSPFGKIRDDDAFYAIGYDNFTLDSFCDGYIFEMHFSDYEGCTVDEEFITEKNMQEAIDYIPNFKAREFMNTIESFINSMENDTEMERFFGDLE